MALPTGCSLRQCIQGLSIGALLGILLAVVLAVVQHSRVALLSQPAASLLHHRQLVTTQDPAPWQACIHKSEGREVRASLAWLTGHAHGLFHPLACPHSNLRSAHSHHHTHSNSSYVDDNQLARLGLVPKAMAQLAKLRQEVRCAGLMDISLPLPTL